MPVLEKICASGPLTNAFDVAPEMETAAPSVSKFAAVVFNTPLFKASAPFTVQAALNVTPLALLIVKLLTGEIMPVVTWAVLPVKI